MDLTQRRAETEAEQKNDHLANPLRAIHRIERKVDHLMATVEDLMNSLNALKADLEGLASAAQAEFAKLEQEVKEAQEAGGTPVNLDPVKEAIDNLDNAAKGIVVPTT